jgi:hypothetical protein
MEGGFIVDCSGVINIEYRIIENYSNGIINKRR